MVVAQYAGNLIHCYMYSNDFNVNDDNQKYSHISKNPHNILNKWCFICLKGQTVQVFHTFHMRVYSFLNTLCKSFRNLKCRMNDYQSTFCTYIQMKCIQVIHLYHYIIISICRILKKDVFNQVLNVQSHWSIVLIGFEKNTLTSLLASPQSELSRQ